MSTLKKVLALTLALAMVMSLGVFAAFTDQDKINEDCVGAMELMNDLKIITGDNGNAKPLANITRAEAATMIFRLMNKGSDDASMYKGMKVFTDVPAGIWFEGYVNYCFTMGIISGRTPTTFDPQAPVTGMEIAKMLLGCLKYNAEKQGYTGANWARNVQNDAFMAGLLDDYGMALTAPAQRQWVAVMFDKSLSCYIARYYLGELEIKEDKTNTMGAKNFGLETKNGVLTAAGYVDLEDSLTVSGKQEKADYCYVDGDGLGKLKFKADASLLGQDVEVVYNAKTGKVYGISASGDSVVGATKVDAITYKTSTKKYTFGTLTAKLDDNFVVYMTKYEGGEVLMQKIGKEQADDELAAVAGENYNMDIRAIDQNDDGTIDLAILQTYAIVEVASISHNKTTDKWKVNGVEYPKGQLVGVDKLEKGDVVMVTPNVANQTLDLNALTPTAAATLTRQTEDTAYTIGGKTYKAAGVKVVPALGKYTLGNDYVVYTDGAYAVKIGTSSDRITVLPDICMLTAAGTDVTAFGTNYMVKVLTLDGKVTQYVYNDNDVDGAIVWNSEDANKNAITNDMKGTAYIYGVNKDGSIYFKSVAENTIPNTYNIENAAGILGNYSATKGLMGAYRMASDTKLFVQTAEGKFKVMSLAELNKQIASGSLYVFAPDGKIGTVMGGVVTLNTTTTSVTSSAAYAIITDVYTEWDATEEDTLKKVDVILADGTEDTMVYTGNAPIVGEIYKYTVTSGEATFANSELAQANLTVIDGTYMTIGTNTEVANKDMVVVLYNKTAKTIEVSSLDAIDLTKTCKAQTVLNKAGEVVLLYVQY